MDCSALSMPLSHCALYNCWNSEKKKIKKYIHIHVVYINPQQASSQMKSHFPQQNSNCAGAKIVDSFCTLFFFFFLFQMVLKSFKVQRTLQIESPNKRLDARIESRETETETSCKNMKNYSALAYHTIP